MCSLNLVIKKSIYNKKLSFKRDKYFGFDFSHYRSLKELFKGIYYRKISIDEVERIQNEHGAQLNVLENYRPRNPDYVKEKKTAFEQCKQFL